MKTVFFNKLKEKEELRNKNSQKMKDSYLAKISDFQNKIESLEEEVETETTR